MSALKIFFVSIFALLLFFAFTAVPANAQTSSANCLKLAGSSAQITCLTNLVAQLTAQLNQLLAQKAANNAPSVSPSISNSNFVYPAVVNRASLSAADEKISTDLLGLINGGDSSQMKSLKQFVGAGDSVATIDKNIPDAPHNDLVYVYVQLQPAAQTSEIDSMVWKVVDRDEENHFAVVLVEPNKLEALASLSDVKSIWPVTPPSFESGSVTTEGDAILETDKVRTTYSQSGAGVKIGVISNGVDSIASSKATGDLPANVTVLSNSHGGNEGIEMLEIIYDMAPGAALYFHDSGSNVTAFDSAVDSLISAGCKIIVDDSEWWDEPFFQDGTTAQHVASVLAANNIVYITAAGNDAYSGTLYGINANGHFQGDYQNNGLTNFETKTEHVNIPLNGGVDIFLEWNDGFGSSANDYDLYLSNVSLGDLGKSENRQTGSGNPLEVIHYTNTTLVAGANAEISINKYSGSAKTLEMYIHPRGGAVVNAGNLTPADSIYGHAAVPGVITVGAASAASPGQIEPYSSQGPVTILGTAQRAKPDITGIDGVSVTGAGGRPVPYYGTSAAAPGIAAIAAQLWGAFPTATGSQIRDYILNSAVDLGTAGADNIYGHGRADALLAYQSVPTTGVPPACTSFNYSAWTPAQCPAGGIQTRTVTGGLPAGCTGGTPGALSQTCTPSSTLAIKVDSPAAGATWALGSTQNISWTYTGNVAYIDVFLINDAVTPSTKVYLAQTLPASQGYYPWTIPSATATGAKYKIRVQNTATIYGDSGYFNISAGTPAACGNYLCNAGAGYDGPTGWGTPNGTGAF